MNTTRLRLKSISNISNPNYNETLQTISHMFAILITRRFTGYKTLFPVLFETREEAEKQIPRLPYLAMYNDFEVKELF